MIEFLGHLHPVLVHLPIGILLIAIFLKWLAYLEKYQPLQPAVKITMLIGMITALLSCITGYLLSMSGDYDQDLVSWHMWMGIAMAIVSMLLYVRIANAKFDLTSKLLSILLFILIMVTGHLGGSITHGSDFLTTSMIYSDKNTDSIKSKPIANVQEAFVYADVIQPLMREKCYGCHGPNRQKGGLRMDDVTKLMKGGKDGIVIKPHNADSSELIKRLLLPREDEHHMPPKQKSQLNERQIALFYWWINQGADFNKKVKDISQPEKIKPILLTLQANHLEHKAPANVPSAPVEKADEKAVEQLQSRGVVVMPVAQNNNYLMANFVTATSVSDNDIALLLPLKKQLVWLKLGDTPITDSSLSIIAQCTNLTLLQLNNTKITDNGLSTLSALNELQSINLAGTVVTAQGVLQLKGLKKLQSVYLYQSKVNKAEWPLLKTAFSKTLIDSGGYVVPLLATDTTIVKPVAKK